MIAQVLNLLDLLVHATHCFSVRLEAWLSTGKVAYANQFCCTHCALIVGPTND
jgi:hypothetical protein